MPAVSVIMGVRNSAQFLGTAVASLQAQTFADWELVIVDNGSTDGGVAALLATQPDPRIRVFHHGQPLGPGPALAAACREACGRYLAVLDSDDIALPRRLEIQHAYLELRPEVIMVGTGVELIDEAGKVLGREAHVGMHEDIFTVTAYFHALRHSSVMFRRELLERVQYRGVLGAADHDFFARTAEVGRIEVLPALLCRYRLRDDSVSHAGDKGAISRALVCMLTHRRRRGLPEEHDFWANKFSVVEKEAKGDARRAAVLCAQVFAAEGMHDLAAVFAWHAMRAGAYFSGAVRYGWATLNGLRRSRGAAKAVIKGWLKEPVHQLVRAGGAPDRLQF
jgi:glycosyltransferase involved in cell wall biosynthesis